MRNVYVLALSFLLTGFPQTSSAQFFKKLGAVLNEVDKALGDDSTKKEEKTKETSSETNTSQNKNNYQGGIHQANYNKGKLKTVIPHRTSMTKLISYDGNIPEVYAFSNGLAYVRTGGEKGGFFMDAQGNKVFDYDMGYGTPPVFSSGHLIDHSSRTGEAKILNTKGEVVKIIPKVLSYTQFVDGVAALTVSVKDKFGWSQRNVYINTKGEFIFNKLVFNSTMENLKSPSPLCENRAAFYDYNKQRWGYRDANGNIAIPATFEDANNFSEGLALVAVKDDNGTQKWGYIDSTGVFIIPASYTIKPGSFSNGLAPVVNKSRQCFFIDKTGKIVSKAYSATTEFHNGIAMVRNEERRPFIINTKFEILSYGPYADISYEFPSDIETDFRWKEKDIYIKETLISPLGDMLMHPVSSPFNEGYAPCNMSSFQSTDDTEHAGLINRKGEFVVEFIPNEF